MAEDKKDREIFKSTDYDSFKILKPNRSVTISKVRRLMRAIKEKNLLTQYPILVNRKKEIIDGQNRLMAARILQVPVYYYTEDPKEEPMDFRDNAKATAQVNKYTYDNYLESYMKMDMEDYKVLDWYHRVYGIPLATSAKLLGEGMNARSAHMDFKEGNFKVKRLAEAKQFGEFVNKVGEFFEHARHNRFLEALRICSMHPKWNEDRFLHKLEGNRHLLYRAGDIKQAIQMIENVFNHNQQPRTKVHFWIYHEAWLSDFKSKFAKGEIKKKKTTLQ